MPREEPLPLLIDSHVHLWPGTEMESLGIYSPSGPFNTQHSVEEYKQVAVSPRRRLGFVFVEVDRKHDLKAGTRDGSGWKAPLDEIAYLSRIALGRPKEGEGHSAEDAKLCLAIIPWAPVSSGVAVLERYLSAAEEAAGEAWSHVKGFRYLLQDKLLGTPLQDDFIDGLKLLGRRGFTFEVAADHSRRGDEQLKEVVVMVEKAHRDVAERDRVMFIINHLCKPDMNIANPVSDASFQAWEGAVSKLATNERVYIKLSGCFLQISESLRKSDPDIISEALAPWFKVSMDTFGPSRVLFGSDWPICTLGVEGNSWTKWLEVVQCLIKTHQLTNDDASAIFSGAARSVYGL